MITRRRGMGAPTYRVHRIRRRPNNGMGDYADEAAAGYVAPSSNPSMGQQWTDIFKSILPAGMTTLQAFVAQPGQTIKTPTTLITGSGTNLITGGAGGVSTGVWILGGIAVLGLVLMSSKR